MSPTSYRTAPPRVMACAETLRTLVVAERSRIFRMFKSTLSAVSQRPEPSYCSTPPRAWKARPGCRLLRPISTSRRCDFSARSANRTDRQALPRTYRSTRYLGVLPDPLNTCGTKRGGPRTSLVRSVSLPASRCGRRADFGTTAPDSWGGP